MEALRRRSPGRSTRADSRDEEAGEAAPGARAVSGREAVGTAQVADDRRWHGRSDLRVDVWSIGSEFSNEGGEVDPETMRKAAEATRRMIEIAQEASSPVEAPPRRAASMHRPPLPRRCVRPIRPRPLCRRDRRCGMSPEPGARTRRGLHVPAKWSADRVAPRADGSAQIEFKTRGNISEDPALINRITDSYNAKMDR